MNAEHDFAAAAMLRLIARGLAREGIAMPVPVRGDARVPLADKRALLHALAQAHGPEMLLRLGGAVDDAPEEPTLTALLAARDPEDLLARWQRLERYVHTRHRVQRVLSAPGRMRLRHVSLRAGEPPWPAEDLLVWGLLIGLLRRLRTAALAWELDLAAPAELTLHWRPAEAPARATEAAAAAAAAAKAGTLEAARAALAADCAAPWSLARLAAALRMSPRTLQRRLAAEGGGFGTLWTQVRLASSARLLAETREPTAAIGYVCGFADQAHFTRQFHRHTALTPARYRSEFARLL